MAPWWEKESRQTKKKLSGRRTYNEARKVLKTDIIKVDAMAYASQGTENRVVVAMTTC